MNFVDGVPICFVFVGDFNFFISGLSREALGRWNSGVSLW